MRQPLNNWKNLTRGYRFGQEVFYTPHHLGLDLIVPTGTPLYAPEDGIATYMVGNDGGNTIHFQGRKFQRFMHLDSFNKVGRSKGDVVSYKENDLMAYVDSTGLSTVPHLHTDVSRGTLNINDWTSFIDPEIYYSEPIKVRVLAKKEYDLTELWHWFIGNRIHVEFEYTQYDGNPVWLGGKIADSWVTNNLLHYAKGCDIILWIMDKEKYKSDVHNGYFADYDDNYKGVATKRADADKFGIRCVYVKDTKKKRKENKGWANGEQVLGTSRHELMHALYDMTDTPDMTHILDYDLKEVGASLEDHKIDMFKYKRHNGVRLYKIVSGKIREIKLWYVNENSYAVRFLKKRGYSTEIPLNT